MDLCNRPTRILLIGHLSADGGGSSLSFKQLVDILQRNASVEIQVITTARQPHLTSSPVINVVTALRVTFSVVMNVRRMDIVTFHASRRAMILYGPILYLITRVFRKPLVLRLFGGALELEYEALPSFMKALFNKTILRTELLLLQTKHLVAYFNKLGKNNVRWYSNSRKLTDLGILQNTISSACKRFVFLGRIVKEKGIEDILDSIQFLQTGISIDLFGSLDHYSAEHINARGNGIVKYKGVLSFDQVPDTLAKYGALLLPTFYPGEGYPGVVLEAYSQGLPVIATQWRALSELVDATSGMLVPIRDPKTLAQAMNKLSVDVELYEKLRRGALAKRTEFSDKVWSDRFVDWCNELISKSKE